MTSLSYLHPDAEGSGGDFHLTAPAHAWLAVVAAAAGRHHLQLTGAPGTGVPMLAKVMHHLLPDLSLPAARQARRLAATVPGTQPAGLDRRPPWREPHHTCSVAALIGNTRRPGAVSLAHHGVLYLDAANEFGQRQLDAVAYAVRRREITLDHAGTHTTYPADVQLVTGCAPCPCGGPQPCSCTAGQRARHRQRLTPLATLTDLRIDLGQPVRCGDYGLTGGPLSPLKAMVAAARRRPARRAGPGGIRVNGHADQTVMQQDIWRLPNEHAALLHLRVMAGTLTAAQATGVQRVAWTLADLACRRQPTAGDVATALMLHGGIS